LGNGVELTQETKNLFRLTRFGMINCFLVREDDGLTLTDTSLAGSASGIRELPGIELVVGQRESRLLRQDFSLDASETGKKLLGFPGVKSPPTRVLMDGDLVGSLRAIFSPGHTPGHMAYLDLRDGSLIAGDAFTTQLGVTAAGAFKFYFPFPALFSWNRHRAAESAEKLRNLKPARLAVGHGKTIASPLADMDQAIELAFQQQTFN
jgi:glyoxylase-like metal-dependent hydrolase (beta-lactamase superfamily II)